MKTKSNSALVVFVALAVPLYAVASRAQQNGGLYDYPDANQATRNKADAPSQREAEKFRDSLDPETQRIKSDATKAWAVRQEFLARQSANGLAASQGPGWVPEALDLRERGWIVVLTVLGLLISSSAAGYLWWSRRQQDRVPVTVLMPTKPRVPATGSAAATDKNKESKRRAA